MIDASCARQCLQRLHAAVNAHDADVVWEDPAATATLHGRDAVLCFHRDVMLRALPDVRCPMCASS